MNQEMVKVTIDGKEHEYAIGTTYREIVDEYQEEVAEAPVILVMADGKLRELQKKLKGDCTLEFVTTKDHIGFETYKRTVYTDAGTGRYVYTDWKTFCKYR